MTEGGEAPSLALVVQFASGRPAPRRERVRRWVRAAIAAIERPADRYALTVRFVDVDEGRALNRAYRGRDYATNVLTFSYPNDDATDDATNDATDDGIEADVVVCLPVVEREAGEQRKDAMDHCAHLVVHGTLHAAGCDHETPEDAESMEGVERRVLKRFRIADPYA